MVVGGDFRALSECWLADVTGYDSFLAVTLTDQHISRPKFGVAREPDEDRPYLSPFPTIQGSQLG